MWEYEWLFQFDWTNGVLKINIYSLKELMWGILAQAHAFYPLSNSVSAFTAILHKVSRAHAPQNLFCS